IETYVLDEVSITPALILIIRLFSGMQSSFPWSVTMRNMRPGYWLLANLVAGGLALRPARCCRSPLSRLALRAGQGSGNLNCCRLVGFFDRWLERSGKQTRRSGM